MCRALKVLCVAVDEVSLRELKMASVGASWELAPGATTADDALAQLQESRAHIVVATGDWEGLFEAARALYPGIRIISDAEGAAVDAVVGSLDEVRAVITGAPKPAGPVR